MEKLTKEDQSFLASALNAYWNEAHHKLQRNDLGDLERQMYEKQKQRSKEIMDKLDS